MDFDIRHSDFVIRVALAKNRVLDYSPAMPISGSYRRKGGSGTGRLRSAAVCLGLEVFLAAGCAGTSSPPRLAANADQPPLPISDDGLPRNSAVQLASYSNDSRPAVTVAAKPVADDPAYRLPSLKLATDGPLHRLLEPSNDGPWSPDQAVLPWAEFHDNQVTVHNIRNAYYRTVDDYTVRLHTKTFDLRRLTSVDFIVVPFNDNPAIAHVMLSFGFEDKDYLVSSVEIRKRVGQSYSTVTGFFNQYTLMYVLADERDVLWKETIGFQQEAFVYRTRATPEQAQEMFVDVMRRVNKLVREPEFYNTLTNNCTTNVRTHVNHLLPDGVPYDYRVLLPGYSDELAYDLGLIVAKGSFEETRAAAKVNYNAYLYRDDPDFSQKIRGK
ncbi:MAG: DUF4105 domain-containing protein [Thermoguttaceae bacterium]